MTSSHSTADSRRRPGSLLLEMGIVIVLAFTFLVVLVPQFLRARTVARRTQCLNNLKNVALAMQNYSELHDCYPPGYIVRGVEARDPATSEHGPGWGWGVMVLPHLDQQSAYATFDFRNDITGAATFLSPFLCPDGGSSAMFTVSGGDASLVTLAPSNFVGVAGRGSLTEEPGRPAFPGMLYRNSSVRQDDVGDGISNTLLLGERKAVWDGPNGALDTNSTWVGAPSGVFRDVGYLDEERFEGPGSLTLGVVGQTRPISLKLTPNCAPAGIGFSSGHDDRVHFARVDGSCSSISPNIDAEVFVRLGQRSDGEPTGEQPP